MTAPKIEGWECEEYDDGSRGARRVGPPDSDGYRQPDGAQLASTRAGNLEVGLAAPGDYTDEVPREIVLWVLGVEPVATRGGPLRPRRVVLPA